MTSTFDRSGYASRLARRAAPACAILAMLAACASAPSGLVLADDTRDEVSSGVPLSLADADPTTSTTSPAVNTTAAPATVPTTTPSTTRPALALVRTDERIEILGPSMMGIGEWAILRPESNDEFDCRNDGTLAFLMDGQVVHRYDELGGLGGVRQFNGTRGQDAFVVNCEESVERVFVQGSAILPSTGWPDVAEFRLYDSKFEAFALDFAADFGWRNDMFSAHARHQIGGVSYDELFLFDPSGPTIDPMHARLGRRTTISAQSGTSAESGFDLVVPTNWLHDSTGGYIIVSSPDSSSYVQVTRREATSTPSPLAEGDEFLSSDSVDERVWSLPDSGGRAQIESKIVATEWFFIGDDGVRLVRQIPVGNDIVEIEMYADDADSAIDSAVPWLVVELVRVVGD